MSDDEETKWGGETQWPAVIPLAASRTETVDPDGVPMIVKHGKQGSAAAWEFIHTLEKQQSRGSNFTHICFVCTKHIATLKDIADVWRAGLLTASWASNAKKHLCAFHTVPADAREHARCDQGLLVPPSS